ncbi:MAG TPA: hypothetical protein DCW90_17075 [Lachnospiraceae bacterium]|nr:hypothetical protein [Lachnospiraceae bacterium]
MKTNKQRHMIYAAKFDSERYWQPENVVTLPAIRNRNLENIVCAMDELLFALCRGEEDVVLTGIPMNTVHQKYLHELGFRFDNQSFEQEIEAKTCEYHAENQKIEGLSKDACFETYAVLPEYISFAKNNQITYPCPAINVVKKVNSKIYSTKLAKKLGFSEYAEIVTSEEEFMAAGKRLLNTKGGLIVKEEYGVSGKGNLKITEEKTFQTILRNISSQCKKGKEVRFILEPAFQVKTDFSVQYFIDPETGKAECLSVQQIINQERAYHGSVTADKELLQYLEGQGYFSVMERVMDALYKEGYFGDVCVDSMIIEPDVLVPIVEINARKSMSLIKKSLEESLEQMGFANEEVCTFYVDTIVSCDLTMEDVLERMNSAGILFKKELKKGIIPLTSNTLFVNTRNKTGKNQKGRMYFLLTGTREEVAVYREKVTKLCETFGEGKNEA